jgi:hypothetical protein
MYNTNERMFYYRKTLQEITNLKEINLNDQGTLSLLYNLISLS